MFRSSCAMLVLLLLLAACASESVQEEGASAQDGSASADQEGASTKDESVVAEHHGMMLHYTQAAEAENDGEFLVARAAFEAGLEEVPTSPHLLLGLARTAALLGDREGALDALQRYAVIGAHADLYAIGAFDELREDERFLALASSIPPIDAPAPDLSPVVVLEPADVWNEGIACDRETGDLFAGSVKHGEVLRIRGGVQEELGDPATDGVMEVLGLDVDEERRELWACTGRDEGTPGGKHDFGETPRANEVVVYSLESGELIRRYAMIPDGRIQMWNDISVAADGSAYITDMTNGEVLRIRPGGKPELFLALTGYNFPNGIAASEDGTILYVACLETVLAIDLQTSAFEPLQHDGSVYTGLGDGISVLGRNLFVVQNNRLLGNRLLHCRLSEKGWRVDSTQVLRFELPEGHLPYTCASAEDWVFINASAAFDQYDSPVLPPPSMIFGLKLRN